MPDDERTDEPGAEVPPPYPSDSSAQRRAEREVLRAASAHFRRELVPSDLTTPNGRTVKVDGVSDDRSVLVEVYVFPLADDGAVREAVEGQYR